MSGESERREASRELDAEVAAKVMGWKYERGAWWMPPKRESIWYSTSGLKPPRYSTDLAAAFLVVEAMRAKGYSFDLSSYEAEEQGKRWSVLFDQMRDSPRGHGDTPALAICRAALNAKAAVHSPPAPTKEAAK